MRQINIKISTAYDDEGRRSSMTYPNYYLWENEEFPMVAARVVIMGGTTAQSGEKFATDTRDEDGSDYAWNRQYGTVTGRFTTPDTYIASAKPPNPSTWNRYAYGLSDPVNFVDPSGLEPAPAPPGGIAVTGVIFTVTVTASAPSAPSGGASTGPVGFGGAFMGEGSRTATEEDIGDTRYSSDGGGDSGGFNDDSESLEDALQSAFECLKGAVADRVPSNVALGVFTILGAPMPKEWLPPFRAVGNPNTTILSSIGHYLSVTIPRVVNTANLLRAAGRIAGPMGATLWAMDTAAIAINTIQCYKEQYP